MATIAHTCGIRRTAQRSCPACQSEDHARLLALSAERDQWRSLLLDAERRGFERGREAAGTAYTQGLADALVMIKRTNKGFVGELRAHLAMWGGRPRGRFADPQRGDYPGGQAGQEQMAAAWTAWERAQDWARVPA
jgi:hypothetical protein